MGLLEETDARIAPRDEDAADTVKARLDQVTRPYWALSRLLDLAVDLAGMTGSVRPRVERKAVIVMAGDHGVVGDGASKYPQGSPFRCWRTSCTAARASTLWPVWPAQP